MVGKWEDINNAEDRKQDLWSSEEKNLSGSDSSSFGVFGGTGSKSREKSKSFRDIGTNSQRTDTPVSSGGRLDKRKVLELFKKLTRRLELLEANYRKYVGDHRSRLIARLNENEEFALNTDSEVQQLKLDIEEVERVLGASELIE